MYQYELERNLPTAADNSEILHIKCACDQRATAPMGGSAKELLSKRSIPESQLRGAIIRHIKAGRRMFHKYANGRSGELIPDDVQANVTLFENGPGADEIYVEISLMKKGITIYAHEHNPAKRRLPQI